MTKHTSGRWIAANVRSGRFYQGEPIVADAAWFILPEHQQRRSPIAIVDQGNNPDAISRAQGAADAALIAAAPELLEELQHAHRIIRALVRTLNVDQAAAIIEVIGSGADGLTRAKERELAISNALGVL